VDENNEYEEEVLTSSTLSSSLAGTVLLLLPVSPRTTHMWKKLLSKATVMIDYLRAGLLAGPFGNDHQKKYIGPISHEEEGFHRLYCGLSGAAQLVTRLDTRSRSVSGLSGLISAKSHFMTALMTLRQEANMLLGAIQRSDQVVHPLLIGQLQQIALADQLLSVLKEEKGATQLVGEMSNSQRGSRLASSYGNKKGGIVL
jgi:hypothetical protein